MSSSYGFYIQKKSVKLLLKSLRLANKVVKLEVFKFVEKEYLLNKGFYIRRVYFEFFAEVVNLFSIKFIENENYGLIDNYFKMLNDKSELRINALKLVEKILPFSSEKTYNSIVDKIEKINKENTLLEIDSITNSEKPKVKSTELENVLI